ncbi:TonB-dependent receptor [Methylorubrum extorquens]|uniref:TonB-dependent receptor n=1 Tax=Methylorubrum extorquens TaxID=408 RepID=UPI001EE57F7E|nr:TonB-dependent siderophore receptor [Methylorubrum extorquens]MCG5248403.1 TonB-dependent siderophore receptor [Methylorubrum extorquens]
MSPYSVALRVTLASTSLLSPNALSAQVRPAAVPTSEAVELEMLEVTGKANGAPAPKGLNLATPGRSASRLGLTPLQTPASVDVISGEVVRERGQFTVNEAVTQNGVGIASTASPGTGNSSFSARGFVGTNSVMRLYDGVRLYTSTQTFPFDTWNVERIEVLRGPASVLYGEGAIGGVINVVPKRPTFHQINEAQVGFGSDFTRRIAVGSGGPINEVLAYRLDVSRNAGEGWLRPNGDFENLAISGALLYQPSADLSVTLSNDYGDNSPVRYWGSPLVNGRVPRALRDTNFNVADSDIRWRDNWTVLKAEWSPTADLTLRNIAYRMTSDRLYRNAEGYAFLPASERVQRSVFADIRHDQEQIGNRFDATLRGEVFGLPSQSVLGFEVNRIRYRHTNNQPYGGTDTVDPFAFVPGRFINLVGTTPGYETNSDQYALFAENRLVLTEQLSLITGLRYDAPSIRRDDLRNGGTFRRDFEALSWRAGLVYQPLPDVSLYASYATAVDPVGNFVSLTVAQKDFSLSTGRQVEIGAKGFFWDGTAEWTLAGYRIVKDNLVSAVPGQPGVGVQVGSQSSQGVEAALSLSPWENWRIDANVALLHAQYDDFSQTVGNQVISYAGNQPTDVPERVANLWIAYAFAPQWEARLGVQHVGSMVSDFANLVRRPDYTLLNAILDYRPEPNSRLSLRLYNLTDKVYAAARGGNTASVLLGRPRSVELIYNVAF